MPIPLAQYDLERSLDRDASREPHHIHRRDAERIARARKAAVQARLADACSGAFDHEGE